MESDIGRSEPGALKLEELAMGFKMVASLMVLMVCGRAHLDLTGPGPPRWSRSGGDQGGKEGRSEVKASLGEQARTSDTKRVTKGNLKSPV